MILHAVETVLCLKMFIYFKLALNTEIVSLPFITNNLLIHNYLIMHIKENLSRDLTPEFFMDDIETELQKYSRYIIEPQILSCNVVVNVLQSEFIVKENLDLHKLIGQIFPKFPTYLKEKSTIKIFTDYLWYLWFSTYRTTNENIIHGIQMDGSPTMDMILRAFITQNLVLNIENLIAINEYILSSHPNKYSPEQNYLHNIIQGKQLSNDNFVTHIDRILFFYSAKDKEVSSVKTIFVYFDYNVIFDTRDPEKIQFCSVKKIIDNMDVFFQKITTLLDMMVKIQSNLEKIVIFSFLDTYNIEFLEHVFKLELSEAQKLQYKKYVKKIKKVLIQKITRLYKSNVKMKNMIKLKFY